MPLREDNADLRLAETAIRLELYDDARKRSFEQRRHRLEEASMQLRQMRIGAGRTWRHRLADLNLPVPQQGITFSAYTHRQDVDLDAALSLLASVKTLDQRDLISLKARIHYDGYLQKQDQEVARFRQLECQRIPSGFDYQAVHGLSTECRQRLQQERPQNLGQASRLSGMTPAAITCLMIYLRQT